MGFCTGCCNLQAVNMLVYQQQRLKVTICWNILRCESDQPSRTICAAHAHVELSVELCLAAAKHSVQQLLFVLQ